MDPSGLGQLVCLARNHEPRPAECSQGLTSMPIEYRMYHDRRLVWAEARGILIAEDLFDYQRTVWALLEVQGYDELVDMTAVSE